MPNGVSSLIIPSLSVQDEEFGCLRSGVVFLFYFLLK